MILGGMLASSHTHKLGPVQVYHNSLFISCHDNCNDVHIESAVMIKTGCLALLLDSTKAIQLSSPNGCTLPIAFLNINRTLIEEAIRGVSFELSGENIFYSASPPSLARSLHKNLYVNALDPVCRTARQQGEHTIRLRRHGGEVPFSRRLPRI